MSILKAIKHYVSGNEAVLGTIYTVNLDNVQALLARRVLGNEYKEYALLVESILQKKTEFDCNCPKQKIAFQQMYSLLTQFGYSSTKIVNR